MFSVTFQSPKGVCVTKYNLEIEPYLTIINVYILQKKVIITLLVILEDFLYNYHNGKEKKR